MTPAQSALAMMGRIAYESRNRRTSKSPSGEPSGMPGPRCWVHAALIVLRPGVCGALSGSRAGLVLLVESQCVGASVSGGSGRSALLVVNDLIFSIDCIGTISLFCLSVARFRKKTMQSVEQQSTDIEAGE